MKLNCIKIEFYNQNFLYLRARKKNASKDTNKKIVSIYFLPSRNNTWHNFSTFFEFMYELLDTVQKFIVEHSI